MKTIQGESIDRVLQKVKRVYLCGHLNKVNDFEHIENDGLEIGISRYKVFTADLPHVHTFNDEYNFVLKGELKVYLYDEHKEYIVREGDLFLIEPNMPYISKAMPGTEVIFVKTPGGNDKQLRDIDPKTAHWMENWDNAMSD